MVFASFCCYFILFFCAHNCITIAIFIIYAALRLSMSRGPWMLNASSPSSSIILFLESSDTGVTLGFGFFSSFFYFSSSSFFSSSFSISFSSFSFSSSFSLSFIGGVWVSVGCAVIDGSSSLLSSSSFFPSYCCFRSCYSDIWTWTSFKSILSAVLSTLSPMPSSGMPTVSVCALTGWSYNWSSYLVHNLLT